MGTALLLADSITKADEIYDPLVDDFLILTVIRMFRMNLKDYCHRSLPRRRAMGRMRWSALFSRGALLLPGRRSELP